MLYFDTVISFLALVSLCVFFTKKCNINSALTPLLAVSVTVVVFSVAGIADGLVIGGYIYFITSFALGIWAYISSKKQQKLGQKTQSMLTPGFLFFVIMAVVVGLYLAYRQPIFSEWDELSLWGTASKLMKINNRLYTVSEVAWDWIPSQLPGLISLGYFTQFFGISFEPWKVFFGYDLLFLAMFSAAVSAFNFKKYKIFVPTAIICMLTPYFLTIYTRIVFASNIYMSSYGDIPSGMMFGGVLAWYFSMRAIGKKNGDNIPKGFFATFIILMAAGLMKDNTFVIQLVAAGIIVADILFFGIFEKPQTKLKSVITRACGAIGAFLAPVSLYIIWTKYIGYLASLREASGEVGNTSMPLTQVVIEGFKMLFNPAVRSERFNQVFGDMVDLFFERKLCIMGSGIVIVAVILVIFIATIIFSEDKTHKKRTAMAMGLSLGGFIGYYWVLILSYSFIFRQAQADIIEGYNRYILSYYLGWFLLAVVMLAIGAIKSKPFGILKGMLLGMSALVLVSVAFYVRPQMSVLAYPESSLYSWREVERKAEQVSDIIPQGDTQKIFFVSQNDNGLRFFNFCYELLPLQLEFSFGGGRTGPEKYNDGSVYYHSEFTTNAGESFDMDLAGMKKYLLINECEYIFIDQLDDIFITEYKALFTDELQGAINGETLVYKRVSTIGEGMQEIMYAPLG